ncbi:MAG: hypothetical protein M1436_10530, partial [Acidobacteria bacterium]|nr:hypothetical protein [Acidobacteriota bacterium]
MKGPLNVLPALAILFLARQLPAQSPSEAARDLARKVVAVLPRESVALTFRNSSSLETSRAAALGRELESELRALGAVLGQSGPELRVTLSESFRAYLLIAEVRRGEESVVLMADWPRAGDAANDRPPVLTIEKKLLWRQAEPILDAVLLEGPGDPLLFVLDPARIAVYVRQGAAWQPSQSFPITPAAAWPRDPRGRLFVQTGAFQGYLPGMVCRGVMKPASLDCRPGENLWPLYSGSTLIGRAGFARNAFNGPLTTAANTRAAFPPFFSAALGGTR